MYSWGYFGAMKRFICLPSAEISLVEPPAPMAMMEQSSSMMQMLYRFSVPGMAQPTFSKPPAMFFWR